ncbi:MAG: hypothetical protein H6810_11260 [Phycisphaeraceae bacterium]|nr:MAG: hypothetical protein H6810_11260 [Phycisphaeraceae bacterium]
MQKALSIVAVAGLAASALAQTAPLRFDTVPVGLDSGVLPAPADGSKPVFSQVVETPGADWIRLWFGDTLLPEGAQLMIMSGRTGDVQYLNAQTLSEWSNSSAYFVGDSVFVDLYVPTGTAGSRVVVDRADAGLPPLDGRTICDTVDDRKLSDDPRSGRLASIGCTGWLFNNRPNTAATADHCGPNSGEVMWFSVPLRTSTGGVVPPPPKDQYAIDLSSVQNTGVSGVGNDWSVFGVFNNSTTGLAPLDAQLKTYVLATQAPPVDGRPINIIGYGVTSSPIPSAWYTVQKSHTGVLYNIVGTTLQYRTDTTGGNSGSCVLDAQDNRAIGIHTHGGCTSSATSYNQGTSINNTGWRNALLIPRGVAGGPVGAVINMLDDPPTRVDPAGGTSISVELLPDFTSAAPQPGVTLHSNDGDGWVATAMTSGGGDEYHTPFPSHRCGATVNYYFTATAANGSEVRFPPSAPDIAFHAIASGDWDLIADLDFESAPGWTVDNTGVSAGGWERGVPPATDTRGGPREDADGSGSCWTTGVTINVDLDGGPTRLVSPVYDLSAALDPYVDASLFLNSDGTADTLGVEFSADGGATWTSAGSTGPTPGWRGFTYRVADTVALTANFRVRFSLSDSGVDNTIEGGVDSFVLRDVTCADLACAPADIAEPFGVLDLADVQMFIVAFLAGDSAADLVEPFGVVDLADVQAFIASFVQGCP